MVECKNKYFVYVYLDPRRPGLFEYCGFSFHHEPFYVGKGGTKKQHRRHLYESKEKTKNTIKFNKIKKIRQLGMEPIIVKVATEMFEQDAFDLEIKLIDAIGRVCNKTGTLANINDGGSGGVHVTDENRYSFSAHLKGKTYEESYGKEKALELKKEDRNLIEKDPCL